MVSMVSKGDSVGVFIEYSNARVEELRLCKGNKVPTVDP